MIQNKEKNLSYFFFFIIILIQFLFVDFYWNDKTTTSARIIDNMISNGTIYAKNFICFLPDRSQSTYIAWGEEPPVFHYFVFPFKFIFGNFALKIVPLISYVLNILGLFWIINILSKTDKKNYLLLIPLSMTPSLYIHAIRFLPDNLALTFLIFGLAYLLKENFLIAFILFLLSVTTKAIAIVPIFFLCLFIVFFKLLPMGLTIIPTLLWFYFLKQNNIENPFFDSSMQLHHTGGSDFSILQTSKYWSKIFQWYFYRGIGVLWFGLFLVQLKRFKNLEINLKIFILTALSFILNVIFLRGPQISAPWYSFYYQIFFIVVAGVAFLNIEKKWQYLCIILAFISSVSFLKYNSNFSFPEFKDASIELPCNFHEYNKTHH